MATFSVQTRFENLILDSSVQLLVHLVKFTLCIFNMLDLLLELAVDFLQLADQLLRTFLRRLVVAENELSVRDALLVV